MREIKFRAWHDISKKMVLLDEPYICEEYSTLSFSSSQDDFQGIGKLPTYGRSPFDGTVEGKGYVVMQFTGLKDKNGKEIYEGDIVKHLSRILNTVQTDVVEWSDNAEFDGIYQNGTDEVIGNIWENSELLSANEKV